FGSELDQATQKQLARGARVVEVLKQPQYQPMPVEQQIMVIFAVTNGYLDDVPVPEIRGWEQGFRDFMVAQHPDVGEEIRTRGAGRRPHRPAARRGGGVQAARRALMAKPRELRRRIKSVQSTRKIKIGRASCRE